MCIKVRTQNMIENQNTVLVYVRKRSNIKIFKWIICVKTHLEHTQHLYLSKHKLQEYPIVSTDFLASRKKPLSYQFEPHQDLKCVMGKKRVIYHVIHIMAI